MNTESTDVAVVDLKNTTDKPLRVSVTIGGVERHIVTLAPGESTRQVTPSGVAWTFGVEPEADGAESAAGEGEGEGEVDEAGGSKGGARRLD